MPVITGYAAKATNSYGDRLLLSYKAEKAVFLCVTDKDIAYPDPNKPDDCSMFHSPEKHEDGTTILLFTNYNNHPKPGSKGGYTRLYITLWGTDETFDAKTREAFIVNITAMTQPYINASSLVKWDFLSSAQRGMPRYMSFAIDMTGINVHNASLVVGPDCNAS